jgi:predicted DNA binding CopG/RHH family protein
MKKRSLKAVQRRPGKRDLQVEEFEKRDLGEDIRSAGGLRPIRKTLPTSIVLEQDLIDKLRKKAAKRGLGYQTMLKVIVREHVDEY